MEDYNYYQVQGWMVNNLGLKGNELICYAIIYSFSQDEESKYMGGVKYLCGWMNVSEPTVISVLEKLTSKGLIEPIKVITDTCKRVYYRITKDSLVVGNLKNLSKGNLRNLSKVTKDSLVPIYNNNNKDNNKEKNKSNDLSKNKRFVKPSVEQIAEYIREKKLHFEAERFFDYYESKGWMIGKNHMKDWKAACRTWEAKRKSEIKEEEKEELPAGLTPETWALRQGWMYKFIPRIAERITPDMFLTLQGLSHFKPDVFKDIIEDIDKSDFNGDIVMEFDRLRLTDNYASRIDL